VDKRERIRERTRREMMILKQRLSKSQNHKDHKELLIFKAILS
jgi:hypothetical protein